MGIKKYISSLKRGKVPKFKAPRSILPLALASPMEKEKLLKTKYRVKWKKGKGKKEKEDFEFGEIHHKK